MITTAVTFPSFLFGVLVATFYGVFYHLIRSGGVWRLLLYIVLSQIGFALGYYLGVWRNWFLFPIGTLDLGLSSLGSLLVLLVGDWLSLIELEREKKV